MFARILRLFGCAVFALGLVGCLNARRVLTVESADVSGDQTLAEVSCGCGAGTVCGPDNSCLPDADGDGIADATDNCPTLYNPTQAICDGGCCIQTTLSGTYSRVTCNAYNLCEYARPNTSETQWEHYDVWIRIPAGSFTMGKDNTAAQPAHEKQMPSFFIGKYEISVGAYQDCVTEGKCTKPSLPSALGPGKELFPQNGISRVQAITFCGKFGGRLPTEAEWEYVACGGDNQSYTYPWGLAAPLCELAVISSCPSPAPASLHAGDTPQGQKGSSPFGAQHMAGNLKEWVADCWYPDYTDDGPAGSVARTCTANSVGAVLRGGSFDSDSTALITFAREMAPSGLGDFSVGARCVISPQSGN